MFHSRDGFCFERLDDGSVRVRVCVPVIDPMGGPNGQAVVRQTVLPANEWGSVIATVSAEGETSEKYQGALDFHGTELHGSDPI